MSSYSFSHQFYQHWTQAPEPIRAAIVQELTDITTLLQPDTSFEGFTFNIKNLDVHVDDLYRTHDEQQAAAKELADKQAQQEAEQQKLDEQEKLAQEIEAQANEAKDKQRQQREEQQAKDKQEAVDREMANKEKAAKEEVDQQKSALNTDTVVHSESDDAKSDNAKNIDKNSAIDEKANNKQSSAEDKQADKVDNTSSSSVTAIKNSMNLNSAINLTLKSIKPTANHEDLIRELEMQIDDYLTEQMMQISEDLKSWLRAEVSQQLSGKELNADTQIKAKSN